jgi:hypothetical protein
MRKGIRRNRYVQKYMQSKAEDLKQEIKSVLNYFLQFWNMVFFQGVKIIGTPHPYWLVILELSSFGRYPYFL